MRNTGKIILGIVALSIVAVVIRAILITGNVNNELSCDKIEERFRMVYQNSIDNNKTIPIGIEEHDNLKYCICATASKKYETFREGRVILSSSAPVNKIIQESIESCLNKIVVDDAKSNQLYQIIDEKIILSKKGDCNMEHLEPTFYSGKIGRYSISMRIEISNRLVNGVYFYHKKPSQFLTLTGEYECSGDIFFYEKNSDNAISGIFKGVLTQNQFIGKWQGVNNGNLKTELISNDNSELEFNRKGSFN